MLKPFHFLLPLLFLGCSSPEKTQVATDDYNDPHRPQIHFSPKKGWMNDPNGMVYHNGVWHLFYQYYPDSTVWGPMHWGHATSPDLVHWKEVAIALYPDTLGYIFSGSAVVDSNNTSGFGKDGKVPLVAIFTHHDTARESQKRVDVETQSLAYSLDDGKTWTKYNGNPVLPNPGIRDFRDPKVSWNEQTKRWIMTLATMDRITFYSSPDLKSWKKESEFGKEVGAHGGVWECPDLFPLDYKGTKVWILVVNINPGGPNGGSATQYFTGQFDGHTFTPYQTDTRWIDYGPDEYAGITWSNTGDRKVFMGWMSNWQYANLVPTKKWRSAMTIARELGLEKIDDKFLVTSQPIKEMDAITGKTTSFGNVASATNLSEKAGALSGGAMVKLKLDKASGFSLVLTNNKGDTLKAGYDADANQYFIDRTHSGKKDFEKGFAGRHIAPRFSTSVNMDCTFVIDDASLELFADDGLSVMTSIFFPNTNYTKVAIVTAKGTTLSTVDYTKLNTIW